MNRAAPHPTKESTKTAADPCFVAGGGIALPAGALDIILLLGFLFLLAGEMLAHVLGDWFPSVHLPVLPWIGAMAVMLPGPLHVHDFPQAQADDVDFARIRRISIHALPWLLERWLPGGQLVGSEYTVRNPVRADRNPGSFRINVNTGAWSDFATDARGGDPIALHAYLTNQSQTSAAIELAGLLGIGGDGHAR